MWGDRWEPMKILNPNPTSVTLRRNTKMAAVSSCLAVEDFTVMQGLSRTHCDVPDSNHLITASCLWGVEEKIGSSYCAVMFSLRIEKGLSKDCGEAQDPSLWWAPISGKLNVVADILSREPVSQWLLSEPYSELLRQVHSVEDGSVQEMFHLTCQLQTLRSGPLDVGLDTSMSADEVSSILPSCDEWKTGTECRVT